MILAQTTKPSDNGWVETFVDELKYTLLTDG